MKRLLWLFLLLACALPPSTSVQAQDAYPSRPVKIICGFPPGTTLDIVTRIFAQKLEASLGQPFVIENRAGASGNLAQEVAARATPDGYTLAVGGVTQAMAKTLFKNSNYDLAKDFDGVAYLSVSPNALVVSSSLGVNSVAELIALAKRQPGKLNYGTGGTGTMPHVSTVMFAQLTGIDIAHVPYRGTNQALIDLLAGRLSMMMAPAPTAMPHIKDSRLKFLATTSLKQSSLLPGLPPLAETPGLAGFDSTIWQGMWAPKGTPKAAIKRIHDVMNAAAASPEMRKVLADNGAEPVVASSEEWSAFMASEVDKWAKVLNTAGIKIE